MNTSRSLLIILFQFTPLHERQRSVWTETLLEGEFQFTPLHERQRTYQCTHIWHFLFQFTPLHERQQGCTPVWRIHEHFNSRLYMRGSMLDIGTVIETWNFNSRLYMRGSTGQSVETISEAYISIHAST